MEITFYLGQIFKCHNLFWCPRLCGRCTSLWTTAYFTNGGEPDTIKDLKPL